MRIPLLLLLLLLSCVFAYNLSTNDPFRTFALQVSRHPKFPICCLKPLSPHDPVEDHVLVSFEEWKAKQQELGEPKEQPKSREHAIGHAHNFDKNSSGQEVLTFSNENRSQKGESVAPVQNLSSQSNSPQPIFAYDPTSKSHQSHFRVPLTDRFNYASIDCSARVHTAHRSAKSPSAVLDSKRDRYMLSPCKQANDERHFIVVELCDDVRIDTVQLANFEFFSGVFKDFSVRVAKTYSTDEEGWVDAGMYRAKNVRGVQFFHTPTFLRDFYRFIRIEFHAYYGNEYYCPVSLLRVYGLTHLEEYKWEQWEEESRAKLENLGAVSNIAGELPSISPTVSAPTSVVNIVSTAIAEPSQPSIHSSRAGPMPSNAYTQALMSNSHNLLGITSSQTDAPRTALLNALDEATDPPQTTHATKTDVSTSEYITYDSHGSVDASSVATSHSTSYSDPVFSEGGASVQHTTYSHAVLLPSSASHPPGHHHNPHAPSSGSVSSAAPAPPHGSQAATPSTFGESIYRVIMNRLGALEGNHTLYTRYVEQQNTAVRDVLKRLSEDVGRLEGIGRAHAQAHQRAVQEWERQMQQLQMEFKELSAMVDYLSDEVVLEKRLGVAQLCLLLLVLIFIALTRGSRGEPIVRYDLPTKFSNHNPLRELGRHLSLSTDWTKHFKSASSTEGDAPPSSNHSEHDGGPHTDNVVPTSGLDDRFVFPQKRRPLSAVSTNVIASPTKLSTQQKVDLRTAKFSDRERSRTPSFRRSGKRHPLWFHPSPNTHPQRVSTPSKSSARRVALCRSNSHNSEGRGTGELWSSLGAPRSAKSAHLHEVVRTAPVRGEQDGVRDQQLSTEDVFGSPPPYGTSPMTSEVQLRLFTNHQRFKSSKAKDKARLIPNSQTAAQMDHSGVDGTSDESAWEDTDAVSDL